VGFLKKLFSNLSSPAPASGEGSLQTVVQCNRCGEIIQTRISLSNDLSEEYDEGSDTTGYFCRKVLVGKQHCFQQIEVKLTFNAHRQLTDRQITGGKFVEA